MVGAFDGGIGGITRSWKFRVRLLVTLLTVALTTTGPAKIELVTVALATPLVVVLDERWSVVPSVSVKFAFNHRG